jgi:ABC-2 type transport system ATP-binding protein
VLKICNLKKTFGEHAVLRGVSLQVDAGSILGLVGPNGAGKSTLLRCIVGVVQPEQGTITVDGVDAIANNLEARRRTSYAPSETSLYHRMRAGELLRFATAFHARADLDRGLELLKLFQVPAKRRIRHLSHGMKRKVLMAQALVCGTGLIVLDEPMEALDPEARRCVEGLLRTAADDGAAVLFSSHDLTSTERLCDRIAFLHSGEIVREGSAVELTAEAGRVLRVSLREDRTMDQLPTAKGWTWTGSGRRWTLVYEGHAEIVLRALSTLPIAGVRDGAVSLEEVFEALYPVEEATLERTP